MRVRLTWIIALASLAVFGVSDMNVSAQQDVSARAAVEAANRKFTAALARGDAAALASLYSTDAAAYPPNADVVRGRDGIQKLWQSVIGMGIAEATLDTVDVEAQGDLAYETGNFVMKTKDGKVADRGKYVVIWKRTGGQWLLHRDIWNTSMPAASH
jgi:uncharacterized protein (TIGR02246 family)